jgi:hypothetical protein
MQTSPLHTPPLIRWPQVAALLALDLALLLSWMAYNEFQPRLVAAHGYKSSALTFLVVQVIILVLTPPLAGFLTDRMIIRGAARIAVVNLGVSLAAMVFMATALSVSGIPGVWVEPWLPLLIVLWLIAMNVFHSPALSMLELYAPIEVMPGVAALLTVLSGLTAALEPSLTAIVDGLGAPLTFAAGGVAVALSGYAFFRTARTVKLRSVSHARPAAQRTDLALVLAMGLGLGLGESLIGDGLSLWIGRYGALATDLSPAWQSSLLYAIAALVAWPLGLLGDRFGAEPLALTGAVGGIVLAAAAWFLPVGCAKVALCLFPLAYAALAVAALPVAFSRLLPGHKVLGVGVLFSGIELVTGAVKIGLAL